MNSSHPNMKHYNLTKIFLRNLQLKKIKSSGIKIPKKILTLDTDSHLNNGCEFPTVKEILHSHSQLN